MRILQEVMAIHDGYHSAFFYSPVPAKREYQNVLCYHYSHLVGRGERRVILFELSGSLGSKQHLGSPGRDGIQLSLQVGNLTLQDRDIFLCLG